MTLLYYIDDYSDEVVPCDCTLDGWSNWLSKPDPDWNRDAAARPGDRFAASVMRLEEDVIATFVDGEWGLDRDPSHADFLAIRFGPGLGWSADDIVSGRDKRAALIEALSNLGGTPEPGDKINVAVGVDQPGVILVYGGPGGMSVEQVQ
jgi:hypothetical protein